MRTNRDRLGRAWWATSSGRIELDINKALAADCSHPGDCEPDVLRAMADPHLAAQLAALDPALVAAELSEYGPWDDTELSDHARNLVRLTWLACGEIADEQART